MIASAAIRFKDKIYLGLSHAGISELGPKFDINGIQRNILFGPASTQGFITEEGIFVDRQEAARIALACGQIKRLRYFANELDSADLNYPE